MSKEVLGWIAVGVIALWFWFQPYDETDDTINKERSGMSLYTDYGTGCQYLGKFLILTPRIGPDGKPLCDPAKVRRVK